MVIELNHNINLINTKQERLVIGFFDGLHLGHLELFGDKIACTSVLTFVNVPNKKNLLYNSKERIAQLKKLGVQNIYVYDVTENMPANEFFEKYLDVLDPKEIVVGSDFHLGSDHVDVDELRKRYNVTVIKRDERYSSTKIRQAILNRDFPLANQMLLWPYYRRGVVEQHKQVGRELGFPTANIPINEKLIQIPTGVYVTRSLLFGEKYKSATIVGKPMTINLKIKSAIETHLIDYNGEEFYGEELKVIFYEYIGEIKNVLSKSALIKRIKKFVQMSVDYKFIKTC